MTSQLNVDTIVDKAGSGGTNVKVKGSNSTYVDGTTTQNLIKGVAKAWVDHETASTYTIENSLNIASLTDLGTGGADVNLTNNMSNAHNAATGGGGNGTGYSGSLLMCTWMHTSEKFKAVSVWVDGTYYDGPYSHGVVHGDLA